MSLENEMVSVSRKDLNRIYETLLYLSNHDPKNGYGEAEGLVVAEALCIVNGPETGIRLYDIFA